MAKRCLNGMRYQHRKSNQKHPFLIYDYAKLCASKILPMRSGRPGLRCATVGRDISECLAYLNLPSSAESPALQHWVLRTMIKRSTQA